MNNNTFNSSFINLWASVANAANEYGIVSPYSLINVLYPLYYGATNNVEKELGQLLNLEKDNKTIEFLFNLYQAINNSGVAKTTTILATKGLLETKQEFGNVFATMIKILKCGKNDTNSIAQVINYTVGLVHKSFSNMFNAQMINEADCIMANVIHFKANWRQQFDAHETRNDNFYIDDGKETTTKLI